MLLVHESLQEEAKLIAIALRKILGIESRLVADNLTDAFTQIPKFNGYRQGINCTIERLGAKPNEKVFILTKKDLYIDDKSIDDDWIFGYNEGRLSVISVARKKRYDNKQSQTIVVPRELYIKRMIAVAIHEVGHDVVKATHYQEARYVNAKTGHELELERHYTDNTCVMYEFIDIKTPPKEEGFLKIGDEERYDAGLDDLLTRLKPQWFCYPCVAAINIGEEYK